MTNVCFEDAWAACGGDIDTLNAMSGSAYLYDDYENALDNWDYDHMTGSFALEEDDND
jgi:hypothetical protein